jgi:hypothetical protein
VHRELIKDQQFLIKHSNMKKLIIGSLVGAIIYFFWGFLSWAVLPIHLHTVNYTPAQDSLLKIMADNNLKDGAYSMPMADNRNVTAFDSKYYEETERVMKESAGKPMATIYYLEDGYKMNILRGFLFDFIAVFAACIILVPAFSTTNSFFQRWWFTLVIGLIVIACGPLLNYNWMGMPWNFTVDLILDNFLTWGITGLWLAWWFGRK